MALTQNKSGALFNYTVPQLLMGIGAIILLIASLLSLIYFPSITLIKWWIPFIISALIAAASATVLWRLWPPLTKSAQFLPNFAINTIFFTIFLSALFFTLNFFIAKGHEPQKEKVYVEEKYRETHYRSNRTGRRSYSRGAPYYEYYIKVSFPDKSTKNIQLPFSTYKNISSISEIILSMAPGIMGINVIRPNDIAVDNPVVEKKRKRRCRFFGTHGK